MSLRQSRLRQVDGDEGGRERVQGCEEGIRARSSKLMKETLAFLSAVRLFSYY